MPHVQLDQGQIQQSVINLIINAVEAGVRTIEHGTMADEKALEAMADAGLPAHVEGRDLEGQAVGEGDVVRIHAGDERGFTRGQFDLVK